MPLTITRPALDVPEVRSKLRVETDNILEEQATLARDVLRSYTPDRWKGYLHTAVGIMDKIPGGYGVGGPLGRDGLLPNPRSAPRGIIAEFLAAHPEYATRNRGRGRHRSFPQAWKHLPREARELLRDERKRGMYQSGAPAAPYWLIAEEGMERVGVPARYYLRNSRLAISRSVPTIARRIRL